MLINSTGTGELIINTFATNVKIKGFSTIITLFISQLFIGNELLIFLMFMLYLIDFLLGLILAFKKQRFNLKKFFKGASKLLIYGIFLVIGLALDEILNTGKVFISTMFTFMYVSDSISILRKIDALGYDTPMFLEKHLISYKKKLEDERK